MARSFVEGFLNTFVTDSLGADSVTETKRRHGGSPERDLPCWAPEQSSGAHRKGHEEGETKSAKALRHRFDLERRAVRVGLKTKHILHNNKRCDRDTVTDSRSKPPLRQNLEQILGKVISPWALL